MRDTLESWGLVLVVLAFFILATVAGVDMSDMIERCGSPHSGQCL